MLNTHEGDASRRLSVAVVAYKTDPALLTRCLDSIDAAGKDFADNVEIIVHDNSGDDSLEAKFKSRTDVWIASGNVGFARAANECVRVASGAFVLLLNPDAAVSPGALDCFVKSSSFEDAPSVLCGWLVDSEGEVQVDAMTYWVFSGARFARRRRESARLTRLGKREVLVPIQKVSGGACFARKSILEELGPYDERYFLYGEDADFSRRATQKGLRLYAVPAARVSHQAASSQAVFSTLVESARADAAVRLSAYQSTYLVSLLFRLEFLVVTLLGLLIPERRTSSGTRLARLRRLQVLVKWGLSRDLEVWTPRNE